MLKSSIFLLTRTAWRCNGFDGQQTVHVNKLLSSFFFFVVVFLFVSLYITDRILSFLSFWFKFMSVFFTLSLYLPCNFAPHSSKPKRAPIVTHERKKKRPENRTFPEPVNHEHTTILLMWWWSFFILFLLLFFIFILLLFFIFIYRKQNV